jgi:hypothetical protein
VLNQASNACWCVLVDRERLVHWWCERATVHIIRLHSAAVATVRTPRNRQTRRRAWVLAVESTMGGRAALDSSGRSPRTGLASLFGSGVDGAGVRRAGRREAKQWGGHTERGFICEMTQAGR